MKKTLHQIVVKTRLIFFWRLFKSFKEKGFRRSFRYVKYKLGFVRGIYKIRNYFIHRNLDRILKENEGKPIILSLSFIDWDVPLYQRPQHIAIQLAKQGYLYFYHTRNYYDFIDGYKKIGENMYLTNRFDELEEVLKGKQKYVHLYSTNMYEDDDERIHTALKNGDSILYEYIDEISEKISGTKIPQFVHDRHEMLLKDEKNVFVIATATKLLNDVKEKRSKNYELVTNGVVYEHFNNIEKVVPEEMKSILKEKKKIIGYYGALASWFDYDLVRNLSMLRPDWNIVLIGWDYDGTLKKSNISNLKNVKILGPIEYKRLPLYAQWFDVCMIPFLINDVTKSTSPVKVFEYMALGKPIVTTPMPECKKYSSVFISTNEAKDFAKKIEKGLQSRKNTQYLNLLKNEALENTWEGKAKDIKELIVL